MTNKPKGGRGKQAPYQTKTVRVPIPLINQLEKQIGDFRDMVINDSNNTHIVDYVNVSELDNNKITKLEAIDKAKSILKQKKSAKVSLIKLLQVIYNDKTITIEDLV